MQLNNCIKETAVEEPSQRKGAMCKSNVWDGKTVVCSFVELPGRGEGLNMF